jgi:molecular chaperone GrpE
MGVINVKRIEIHETSEKSKDIDEAHNEASSEVDKSIKELPENVGDLSSSDQGDRELSEADEWKDKYLRLYAELENTKKRLEKRMQIELLEKTSAVLSDMLPVADNLERVMKYATKSGDKELVRGLQITLESFHDAMAQYGVSKMEARGKPFNPEYHEALGAVPTPQFKEGTVLEVEQTGYLLDGKVLRPAKVIISGK